MKTWKWQLTVALVVVFLAGGACGFFVALRHEHQAFLRRHSGPTAEHMRRHLARELRLTDDQVAQVGPIIDRTSQELELIRKESGDRVAHAMSESHAKILPFLTPEQRERLEEMKRRRQRMFLPPEGPPPDPP